MRDESRVPDAGFRTNFQTFGVLRSALSLRDVAERILGQ
jgi:hypothetical protein